MALLIIHHSYFLLKKKKRTGHRPPPHPRQELLRFPPCSCLHYPPAPAAHICVFLWTSLATDALGSSRLILPRRLEVIWEVFCLKSPGNQKTNSFLLRCFGNWRGLVFGPGVPGSARGGRGDQEKGGGVGRGCAVKAPPVINLRDRTCRPSAK